MKKSKFDIIYENILTTLNNTEKNKTYKSFEEFRQFCKLLDLIVELDKNMKDTDKLVEASLYFMKETDSDNKPIKFDYLDKLNNLYVNKYKDIFDKLSEYKNTYIVTISGKKDSPKILWG